MSPALNKRSAIRCFEGNEAIEIRDGITFDFDKGLPHMHICTHTDPRFQTSVVTNCFVNDQKLESGDNLGMRLL